MEATRAVLVFATCAMCFGCEAPPDPTDAAPDAARDAGRDAPARDAGPDGGRDAGPPPCEERPITPWDLSLGTWSRDFGPRGLSLDGPGAAWVFDLAVEGGTLYVAGSFSHGGPIPAANVASWTSASGWSALGDGIPDVAGTIAVAPDGTVYVASFPTVGFGPSVVYAYASGAWTTIGTADAEVQVLAIDADGSLLAGGWFRSIDSVTTLDRFARWNGSVWTAVDQPGFDVAAIHVDASGLCVGGRQGGSGGYVACRSSSASPWTLMLTPARPAPPYPNPVNAIVRDPADRLVIGGGVYLGASSQIGGVLRWNGTAWGLLEPGLGDANSEMEVYSLARASDGSIYAVGTFTTIGWYSTPTAYALHVARWSAERWWDIGGVQGAYAPAYAVVSDGSSVFVGGGMTEAFPRGTGAWHAVASIVEYDGARWRALEHPGTAAHGPGEVHAIAVRGSCSPYVAGGFQVVEDAFVSHVGVVEMDGAIRDVATRTGFDYSGPRALAVGVDGALYAGGWLELYDASGAATRTALARNTGADWEAFGPFDSSAQIDALAVGQDGALYVGGTFADPVDPARSHLLRWDGTSWSALGSRLDPQPVVAVAVDGGVVYIAERLADGTTRVSEFAGGAWSALGAPLAGEVGALAVYRGALVAGGDGFGLGGPVATFD